MVLLLLFYIQNCPKYLTINKEDIVECQITRTKLKIGLETFQINLI